MSQLIRSVPILKNNSYLKAINAAGSALLDVLKVDSSDRTILNGASGAGIRFTGSANANAYSSVSVTATGINQIWTDSSRTMAIYADSASGNLIGALSAHSFSFITNGVSRVTMDHTNSALTPASAGGWKLGRATVPWGDFYTGDGTSTIGITNTGGVGYMGTYSNHPLVLITNNTTRMTLLANGAALDITPTTFSFRGKTSDGSDTGVWYFTTGNSYDEAGSRGACFRIQGDDAGGNYGTFVANTGTTSNSDFQFRVNNTSGAGGTFRILNSSGTNRLVYYPNSYYLDMFDGTRTFRIGLPGGNGVVGCYSSHDLGLLSANQIKWSVETGGDFTQNTSYGGSIVLTRTLSSVRQAVDITSVAAGSSISDATEVQKIYHNIGTVGSGQGIKLWDAGIGTTVVVRNGGANALAVYPLTGSVGINALSVGTPVSLAVGDVGVFYRMSSTLWIGGKLTAF